MSLGSFRDARDVAEESGDRPPSVATLRNCGGVCVDLWTDEANCGNCGAVCPSSQVCMPCVGTCARVARCCPSGARPKAEQAKPKTIAIKAGDATQAIGTGGQS